MLYTRHDIPDNFFGLWVTVRLIEHGIRTTCILVPSARIESYLKA